jgi:hypothetical protein
MRKLIMFIFMIISLVTIILFTISVNSLFMSLGFGAFEWQYILDILQNYTFEELAPVLGVIAWGLFQLYGLPLAVFLICLNGLSIKRN